MAKLKNPIERSFISFAGEYPPTGYNLGGGYCPGVIKDPKTGGYSVRILTGDGWRGDTRSTQWDYFEMDPTGLVISSPRGLGKEFNGRIRIVGLDEGVERYKTPNN